MIDDIHVVIDTIKNTPIDPPTTYNRTLIYRSVQ